MDNLFLNRMNSRQEIVKKKQESIFEISIGSLHHFKILLRHDFGMRLFFLTIPKPPCPLVPYVAGGSNSIPLKKDHPFRYIQRF
jgi:hypothetical protein